MPGQLGTGASADRASVPGRRVHHRRAEPVRRSRRSAVVRRIPARSLRGRVLLGPELRRSARQRHQDRQQLPVAVAVTCTGVLAGKSVTAISAGFAHTCAIADGTAYCWGSGADGVLGNGTTPDSATPVAVGGALTGQTVTAISAGRSNTCAVAADRPTAGATTAQWRSSATADHRQRDSRRGQHRGCPCRPDGHRDLGRTARLNRGLRDRRFHARYCWGANTYGAVGDGSTTATRATPVAVHRRPRRPAGHRHLGRRLHQPARWPVAKAYCWGLNEFGELGNNTVVNRRPRSRSIGRGPRRQGDDRHLHRRADHRQQGAPGLRPRLRRCLRCSGVLGGQPVRPARRHDHVVPEPGSGRRQHRRCAAGPHSRRRLQWALFTA